MLSMQHVRLRPGSYSGAPRMHRSQTRRPASCARCQQQQHDEHSDHSKSQRVLQDFGQKMAAIAAASLLMVRQHALTSFPIPGISNREHNGRVRIHCRANLLTPLPIGSTVPQRRQSRSLKTSSRAEEAFLRSQQTSMSWLHCLHLSPCQMVIEPLVQVFESKKQEESSPANGAKEEPKAFKLRTPFRKSTT